VIAFGFLNPWILPFTALIAVPLLIYLWNRQRYQVMPWAAMTFIAKAMERTRRRLKFENLLLLIIRMLIVTLLLLAFGRPVLEDAGALANLEEGSKNVVFVVDASYSMDQQDGLGTVFDRARTAAIRLSQELLTEGDRFGLIVLGREALAAPSDSTSGEGAAAGARFLYASPIHVNPDSKERLVADLNELQPLPVPGDGSRGVRSLIEYLGRFESKDPAREGGPTLGLSKQVLWFTDMQRSTFATPEGLNDPLLPRVLAELEGLNASLTFVDCGTKNAANVALQRIQSDTEVIGSGIPFVITATIKSFAERTVEDLQVELLLNGDVTRTQTLVLEPGETREVSFDAVFTEVGAHAVEVWVKTDGLPIDNRRTLAVTVRERLDVLVVNGDPQPEFGAGETDFLGFALAPPPMSDAAITLPDLRRVRTILTGELAEADLNQVEVLVLANVIALSRPEAEKIEAFVRQGGGALFLLGDQVDTKVWNDLLWRDGKGILPAKLVDREVGGDEDETFYRLAPQTPDHALLQPFAGEGLDLLREPRFWGFLRTEVTQGDASVRVLASFQERRATLEGEVRGEGAGAESPGTTVAREPGGEVGTGLTGTDVPALIERHAGRGRALLFTSSADGAWSNFFAKFAYLMLWQRVASYLGDDGASERNVQVGEPLKAVLSAENYAREILLTIPGAEPVEKIAEALGDGSNRFRITHQQTHKPGLYQLMVRRDESGQEEPERAVTFAVNIDTEEADLARMNEAELRALLPGVPFKFQTSAAVDRLLGSEASDAKGIEIWPYLLMAALALLLIESVLAYRFGKRAAS
jgi:hypothetical protein